MLGAPAALHAQRVLGPGDDAWTLPGGVVRFGLAPQFFGIDDRFSLNGNRESFGASLSRTLDAAALPTLTNLQDNIRAASGVQSFAVSLGVSRADARQTGAIVPLRVSVGITRRLTATVNAPYFTGVTDASLLLDGSAATVGVNPAVATPGALAQNATLVGGLDTAAATLERLANGCIADASSDARCGQIIAQMTAVRSLIDRARTTSNALALTYGGRTGVSPALFVPTSGSAASTGVAAQIAGLRSAFADFGTASVADGSAPAGAVVPPTLTELRALLADSTFGYALGPVARRYRQGFGDIDVGIMLLVFDGMRSHDAWRRDTTARMVLRQSVGFTYRAGTGSPPDPDDPFKPATGDGQNDLEFVSATDLVVNRHLWASLTGRWTKQEAFDGIARIPDGSGSPFVPLSRRTRARTELGDRIDVSLTPRWVVNNYIGIGAGWRWVHQQGLSVTELAPASASPPMSYAGPATTSQELSVGFTWSTVSAWRDKKIGLPLELQYDHSIVVFGSGNVPAINADRISVRAYARLWGR